MTIETYKFSDQCMFSALQAFCIEHSVEAEEFYKYLPEIISQQIIFDNQTISGGHSFKIKWDHPLCEPLSNYLDKNYSFESRVEKMITQYDNLFNKSSLKICYHIDGSYVFDKHEKIRKVYIFEFIELEFNDDYMMLVEFDDIDLDMFETRIFEYYLHYFGKKEIPEELKRPLSQLSPAELDLFHMIYI